jgi:hypothetical protein
MATHRTGYHPRVLRASGLIDTTQKDGIGPVLYVSGLDQQPEWVTDAVNEHREVAR